jgi:hypothetical protein
MASGTAAGESFEKENHFGVDHHLGALIHRLERHFGSRAGDIACGDNDAFVVGLFAPWGCGKSHWLKYLEKEFNRKIKLSDVLSAEKEKAPITLPVFFNAWQYEKEEHLIVPLLKTAQTRLAGFGADVLAAFNDEIEDCEADEQIAGISAKRNATKLKKWTAQKAGMLGDAALSLAAGLSGSISTPFAKINVSLKEMVKQYGEFQQQRGAVEKDEANDPLAELESIYFDLYSYLEKLTGRRPNPLPDAENPLPDLQLNLLFLIDDLDRCLPDKAVEMLEAIKLFLEVKGCGFVVAVDDEVVNRGILYRYKDYRTGTNGNGADNDHEPECPITGSEYLEKIIHLPVRVPPISSAGARDFLQKRYPLLFRSDPSEPVAENEEPLESRLLNLFVDVVPLVPRKLIRAAELFMLQDEVAKKVQLKGYDAILLARLTILQLFAPEVYRLGRLRYARRYARLLVEWRDKSLETLRKDCCSNDENNDTLKEEDRVTLEQVLQPLYNALKETVRRRGGFDPRNAFKSISLDDSKSALEPDVIRKYYELSVAVIDTIDADGPIEKSAIPTGGHAAFEMGPITFKATGEVIREPLKPKSSPTGRPENMQNFLALAFSEHQQDWLDAISTEKDRLEGCVFDDDAFTAILTTAEEKRDVVSVDWLETFEPYFTADQLMTLYQKTDLFGRLEGSDE